MTENDDRQERIEELETNLEQLESRVNTIGEGFDALDKLREGLSP